MGELRVRLQPRARREEIVGPRDGALVVRVTEPPVDGRANAALCRLIARALDVPPSSVTIRRGHSGRDKTVQVDGVETRIALRRFGITP
jgi:uncharacterized protein (TIGR00251 family)